MWQLVGKNIFEETNIFRSLPFSLFVFALFPFYCSTMRREPGAGLMLGLEGQAEVLTVTFNAQNVANTLWAYATMGREPGAGLMGKLEGRCT